MSVQEVKAGTHQLDAVLRERTEQVQQGGAPKYHDKLKASRKLFVRDRLRLLFDDGAYVVEDGLFANLYGGGPAG
jgi:Acetyl-CoA carboxylase, carboxyltransferase component (subunits alpha and beta)